MVLLYSVSNWAHNPNDHEDSSTDPCKHLYHQCSTVDRNSSPPQMTPPKPQGSLVVQPQLASFGEDLVDNAPTFLHLWELWDHDLLVALECGLA